jgi:hypothetical protein
MLHDGWGKSTAQEKEKVTLAKFSLLSERLVAWRGRRACRKSRGPYVPAGDICVVLEADRSVCWAAEGIVYTTANKLM